MDRLNPVGPTQPNITTGINKGVNKNMSGITIDCDYHQKTIRPNPLDLSGQTHSYKSGTYAAKRPASTRCSTFRPFRDSGRFDHKGCIEANRGRHSRLMRPCARYVLLLCFCAWFTWMCVTTNVSTSNPLTCTGRNVVDDRTG